MPKFEYESHSEPDSAFFERRRLRRVRMIVELTLNLISSDRTVSTSFWSGASATGSDTATL